MIIIDFCFQSEALVGTVHDILKFQINFLQGLQKLLTSETGFDEFDSIPQFQVRVIDLTVFVLILK